MAKMHKRLSTGGFVMINNRILRDRNLRLADKGLLSLLISLPDGWNFSIRGLATILPECKDSIAAGVQHLIEAGYIRKEEQSRKGGRFSTTTWYIYDEPQKPISAENPPCPEKSDTAKSVTDSSDTENSPQINKEKQKTEQPMTESSSDADEILRQLDLENTLSAEDIALRQSVEEAIRFVFANQKSEGIVINCRDKTIPVSVVADGYKSLTAKKVCLAVNKFKSARCQRTIDHPAEYMRTLLYLVSQEQGLPPTGKPFSNFTQRKYDFAALEKEAFQ